MKFLKNNKILDIREAIPSDAEAILKFLKQVGSESDNLLIDSEGLPMTVKQEQEYLEKNNKSINSKSFIGICDGKIISVAGFNGSERERIKHNTTLGISVLKDYWNLGVGNHMMNHLVNYCRMTKEINNVILEVREDNEFAIKLYEKFGFKQIGKYSNKVKIKDKFYNELIYELKLN